MRDFELLVISKNPSNFDSFLFLDFERDWKEILQEETEYLMFILREYCFPN